MTHEELLQEAEKISEYLTTGYSPWPTRALLDEMLKVYLPYIRKQATLDKALKVISDEGPCKNPKCAGNGHTTDGNWCWCY